MKQHTRITVLAAERIAGIKDKVAKCICHCGAHFAASLSKVNRGQTRSCGCMGRAATRARLTTHSMRGTPEYKVWSAMKDRCFRAQSEKYADYGGRGITVCDAWVTSFEAFIADMGPCPDGLTLERIDVNGNYEPGNCRWATTVEQNRNKRKSITVEYQGMTMNLADLAELTGIAYKRLRYRIRRGMSADAAVRLYQVAQ